MDSRLLFPKRIPHYHGDELRLLFFVVAVLGFIGIPLWGHVLPLGTLFEVVSGIALIVLAGLVNPHSKWAIYLSVIAAAFGAFLLEATAISYRAFDPLLLLAMREVEVVLLIAALYFGVRTLRAMAQGKVGMGPTFGEFVSDRSAD